MPAEPRITLLGPQRNPRLPRVRQQLGLRDARFATVTAGWRDRENDDALLSELLGGRTVNLQLWSRMQQLWEADPELAHGDRERRRRLAEMQELYVIGLQQAVEAAHRITARRPVLPEIQQMALHDVLDILRDMDERHRQRVHEVHLDFYARYEPQHRPAVLEGRARWGSSSPSATPWPSPAVTWVCCWGRCTSSTSPRPWPPRTRRSRTARW
ncbi:hypothetical protein [Ornithinimicrobium flavum]|uniref:hypothetical protein n=1 Tax=Ornithinimicrobium flavum TaxID=1288636 RepID=UPI001070468C|nr:hypothetical protein [Ornithinimicrobium flavum]